MVTDVRTLAGITERVHSGGKPVANLYIVSHAHESGVLQFSLDDLDKTPGQLQYDELANANKSGSLEQTNPKLIGAWTKIQIKGCAVGRSELTLKALKAAFGGKTSITAPTHAQAYGHDAKYGGEYEGLAGPYIEEKGASKLTLDQAFKAMQAKPEYSFITADEWKSMRSGLKRFDVNEAETVFSGDVPLDTPASALALLRKLVPATAEDLGRSRSARWSAQVAVPVRDEAGLLRLVEDDRDRRRHPALRRRRDRDRQGQERPPRHHRVHGPPPAQGPRARGRRRREANLVRALPQADQEGRPAVRPGVGDEAVVRGGAVSSGDGRDRGPIG